MNKKNTTSTRLNQIMNEENLKQVDIIKKCKPFCKKYNIKLERNDLSQYVSGKIEPGQKKLMVLAEALKVSPAWLMGLDVPKNINETFLKTENKQKISVQEAKIEIEKLINMSDMSEQQKTMIMTPLNYISEESEKK